MIQRRSVLKSILAFLAIPLTACRSQERAGRPSDRTLALGKVDDIKEGFTAFELQRVGVIRYDNSFRAISLVCTHQVCMLLPVDRIPSGYRCPCHGSEFDADGVVLQGPAERALHWYRLSVDQDGILLIDQDRLVQPGWEFQYQS